MVIRIAANLLVIFGIGAILIADETIARSGGGFAAGRTATPPSGIHPAGVRPFIHPARAAASRTVGLRPQALRRHGFRNRDFGFGWPGWWGLQGPEYLGWLGETPDAASTVLMGANTYRIMSGFAASGEPGTEELAALTKVVFSNTLTEPLEWEARVLVQGHVSLRGG